MIYLDYAASTPILKRAREVLVKSLAEDFANPSAAHKLGRSLMQRIEKERVKFLGWAKAEKQFRFIFTGSATESNNMVIRGVGSAAEMIAFSDADHPSVVVPSAKVMQQGVRRVAIVHKPDGAVDSAALVESLRGSNGLLILSHVNNHSGCLTPVEELSVEIKKVAPQLHIHVDGVQAFGKCSLNLEASKIDSYTVSAHKMGGPKGVAGLYLRNSIQLEPLLFGGGHELGLRASTVNAPLIFSWAAAMEEQVGNLGRNQDILHSLSHHLQQRLVEKIFQLELPFQAAQVSPSITTCLLKGVSSDIVLRHLEMDQIYVSSSSACSSRIKGESPVFSALNIPKKDHKGVLRVSIGLETTREEIDFFVEKLCLIVNELGRLQGSGRR